MPIDAATAFQEILPTVLRHAAFAFRAVRCTQTREDRIQEALCLVWKWTLRLSQRDKDVREFPTTVALFATRAVKAGRTLCSAKWPRDAICPVAQARCGFVTQSLPACDTSVEDNPALDALHDNTITPPPEQAAFRVDFPAWRQTYDERRRSIIDEMLLGERTTELAGKFGCTQGRISQLRREFHRDWLCFTGERV